MTTTLAYRLQNAAKGTYPTEAAAVIITRALNGRLITKLAPAIDDQPTEDMAFINWNIAVCDGLLSGGERRLVAIAASLATRRQINLAEDLTGLDDTNASIVLDALAHALRTRRR